MASNFRKIDSFIPHDIYVAFVLIIFAIAATWSDSVAASTEKSQCFASYSSETNELNIPCVVMRNQSGEDNFISGGVLLRLDTAHQNNMRFHMLPGTNPVSANNVMDSCTARMVAQENGGLQLSVPCIGQVDSPERYQAEFAGGPDNQERLILFAITEFANATDLSDSLPIVYLEENSTNSRSTQLRAAPTRIDAPVSGTGWRYVQHNPGGYYEGIAGANDGYSWDINWGSGSADEGKPVYAIEAGCIYNTGAWGGASFGQLLINHTTNNNNWSSGYLHMKNITSKKSNGGCVAKGEVIGYVSDVGKNVNPAISAPHLHFAVYNSHGKSYLQSVNVSINDPTTYPLAPPPTISLTSPNNGATNLPHPVVPLGWTVQNATNLRVVVSTSSSFSGFVDNGGSSSCSNNTTCWTWTWGAENTSPRFTVAQPGITYYWKVRANNSQTGLTSDWTPVRSFATQSAATPPSGGTTPPTSGTTTFSTGAYGNNENRTQTLSIPGATSLTVTVSGLTEQNYDFITVYDANGNQVRRLSGTLNTSFTVTGSSIRVQFTSDYSETRSGATVSIASGGTSTPPSGGTTPPTSGTTPPSGGTTPPTSGTTTFSTGAYGNNENRTQTLSIPGATSLTVTVSGLTEQNYDFITVYDANGNQVRRLSGTLNTSFTVTGSSIRVQFTSDYSETRSGATVSIASR